VRQGAPYPMRFPSARIGVRLRRELMQRARAVMFKRNHRFPEDATFGGRIDGKGGQVIRPPSPP